MRTLDRGRVEPLVLLPFEGPLADDIRAAGVEVVIGPLAVLRRELLSPAGVVRLARDLHRARRALAQLVRERGIEVVQANTSVILGLRAAAPRLVIHVHEIYPRTPVLWPLHRRALLRADAIVCASEATRAALGAGRVIYAGLSMDPHRRPRAQARAALDVPEGAFTAAVLGRLSAWKGQEVLVRALADPRLAGAVGLVAGDAWPGQEHYEQRLREIATTDVRLLGFRDDVETIFGAADVVVIPSTSPDPLPNAALEAAAAGCCVVAAAHGGLPEIIRDGETGRLVAPGDPPALAAVLAELAADPDQRERLGAAAARDVRERFPADGPAREFADLYDELSRTRGRR